MVLSGGFIYVIMQFGNHINMKLIDAVVDKKFKCDSCKGVFDGKNIKLEIAATNTYMMNIFMNFLFVDKHGEIISGYRGPNGNIGDKIMKCPLCGCTHLFGFNREINGEKHE